MNITKRTIVITLVAVLLISSISAFAIPGALAHPENKGRKDPSKEERKEAKEDRKELKEASKENKHKPRTTSVFRGEMKMFLSPPVNSTDARGHAIVKMQKVGERNMTIGVKIEAKRLPLPSNGTSIVAYLITSGGAVNLGKMDLHEDEGEDDEDAVREAKLRVIVREFTDPTGKAIVLTLPGTKIVVAETASPESGKLPADANVLLSGEV